MNANTEFPGTLPWRAHNCEDLAPMFKPVRVTCLPWELPWKPRSLPWALSFGGESGDYCFPFVPLFPPEGEGIRCGAHVPGWVCTYGLGCWHGEGREQDPVPYLIKTVLLGGAPREETEGQRTGYRRIQVLEHRQFPLLDNFWVSWAKHWCVSGDLLPHGSLRCHGSCYFMTCYLMFSCISEKANSSNLKTVSTFSHCFQQDSMSVGI